MLLPNPGRNDIGAKAAIYFKTSYVITKPRKKARSFIRRQNFKTSYVITKPVMQSRLHTQKDFKTSYVITKPA